MRACQEGGSRRPPWSDIVIVVPTSSTAAMFTMMVLDGAVTELMGPMAIEMMAAAVLMLVMIATLVDVPPPLLDPTPNPMDRARVRTREDRIKGIRRRSGGRGDPSKRLATKRARRLRRTTPTSKTQKGAEERPVTTMITTTVILVLAAMAGR